MFEIWLGLRSPLALGYRGTGPALSLSLSIHPQLYHSAEAGSLLGTQRKQVWLQQEHLAVSSYSVFKLHDEGWVCQYTLVIPAQEAEAGGSLPGLYSKTQSQKERILQ